MLTATPPPVVPSTPAHHAYTAPFLPRKPSPLSPRSANTLFPFAPLDSTFTWDITPGSENAFAYQKPAMPQRTYKPTPFSGQKNRDEQRETRRHLFLKRVGEMRETKKWEGRSEELIRSDYFAERRRWEDDMVRRAQEATAFDLDVDLEIEQQDISPPASPERASEMGGNNVPQMDYQAEFTGPSVEEIDDSWIISQDDLNSFDMIDFTGQRNQSNQHREPSSPHYDGSLTASWDDDEYETLFLEFITDEGALAGVSHEGERDSVMDMSGG